MPARPTNAELERFLLGTLPPADAVRVSEWVNAAPDAAETLRALAATDAFTGALKAAARGDRSLNSTSRPGPARTVTRDSTPSTVAPAAQNPFPPKELGGFRIVRELGRGGMGAVFEATDPALNRSVALKVMLPDVAAQPQARGRFLREARAAARVEHEAIVPIYQVGEANGVPFLAMPLLSGEPLDVRLKAGNPLPLADVLSIGRQVADGLAAAHAAGLIHRDIKPSNIWLGSKDEGGRMKDEMKAKEASGSGSSFILPPSSLFRVRILDFGLARAPGDAVLTGAGDVLGTPAYMSVEQARGQVVDFRTDLYSLGVMLYQMTTGKRPFGGGDALAVLTALATETPPVPSQVNPSVPAALSLLIVKLMNKTPAGRPQSARAVADELARIATLPPLPKPKSSPLTPTVPQPPRPAPAPPRLPVKPPPLPTTDTQPVAVESPSAVTEPLPPADAGATEVLRTEPARPNRRRGLLVCAAAAVAAVAVVIATRGGQSPVPPDKGDGKGEPGGVAAAPNAPAAPYVPPAVTTLPEGDQGKPDDPARKLAVWLNAQGWDQHMLVWNGSGWVNRHLHPQEALPAEGGRWMASNVTLTFDDKRPMTDADLKPFDHPALAISSLTIRGRSVTDARLDQLTRLPFAQKLGSISLSYTAVTDDGIMHLTRCKSLSGIGFYYADLTRAGVRRLVNAVPTTTSVAWTSRPDGTAPPKE